MRTRRDSRPRPHRTAALAAGAGALSTALLVAGCDGTSATASVAEQKAFSAVRFTFGARGGIEITGASRAAVEPAGSRPASAGRAQRFDRPGGRLLVVLRHWPETRMQRASRGRLPRLLPPDEPAVETAFLVDTSGWVRADLDGNPLQWLRRDTIRIDATNTAAGDLTRLTLSGPHGGRSGQPVPPPHTRACVHRDAETPRRAALPKIEKGTGIPAALARLTALCLDVQYAAQPGGTRPGAVRQVLLPLAGHVTPTAAVPPPGDTTPPPGLGPGDRVLLDPSRPATVVLAR